MRNCSETLPWEVTAGHLSHVMNRLKWSGYDHKYQLSILNSALVGYRKQVAAAQQPGGRPLHRLDTWNQASRTQSKAAGKSNWFKAGGFSTVLFVPPTPGSHLAEKIRKMELETRQRLTWAFRVVELGGHSIKSQLQTLNLVAPAACGAGDCFPCPTGKLGTCARNNVCYKITCPPGVQQQQQTTKLPLQQSNPHPRPHLYIDGTSLNMRSMSAGHVRQFLAQDPSSALHKRTILFHGGVGGPQQLLLGAHHYPQRPTLQTTDWGGAHQDLMNSRAEFKQPRVSRVTIASNLGDLTPPPHADNQVGGPPPHQGPPLGEWPEEVGGPPPSHNLKRQGLYYAVLPPNFPGTIDSLCVWTTFNLIESLYIV